MPEEGEIYKAREGASTAFCRWNKKKNTSALSCRPMVYQSLNGRLVSEGLPVDLG